MAKKKRAKFSHNNEKSTWENTAKEQPYLMPGTDAYEEYQEDLQMHDPFKPDDVWHNKQEQHDENHSKLLMEKAENQAKPNASKRNTAKQVIKASQFAEVKQQAIDKAKTTETLEDDKKAARMMPKDLDKLVYNSSVTEDDFLPKALKKYQ